MVRNVKKLILFDSGEWTMESGQWRVESGQLTMESGQWTEAKRETLNIKH